MKLSKVFVSLGGNIGDSIKILKEALSLIEKHKDIYNLKVSRFYRTTPVSILSQDNYTNIVCSFDTSLNPLELLSELQKIELCLGKIPKPKEAPRIVDCDILFYDHKAISLPELEIPHPRWRERLFVLLPLSDLVDILHLPGILSPISLKQELETFCNNNHEIVIPIEGASYEKTSPDK